MKEEVGKKLFETNSKYTFLFPEDIKPNMIPTDYLNIKLLPYFNRLP